MLLRLKQWQGHPGTWKTPKWPSQRVSKHTLMKPAPSLPALVVSCCFLFLWTIKKLPPQPAGFGRAASGGALAPQPTRATCNQPEFAGIRTISQKPLFPHFFEFSLEIHAHNHTYLPHEWTEKNTKGSAGWTRRKRWGKIRPKFGGRRPFGFSRLNPNGGKPMWVQPAEPKLWKICEFSRLNPNSAKNWVELAEPKVQCKKMAKKIFLYWDFMLDFLRDFMLIFEEISWFVKIFYVLKKILCWFFTRFYVCQKDFILEKFLQMIKKLLKSLPSGL